MSRENLKCKSVHFNKNTPDDKMMLKKIGKRTFSKYVKQLIKADLARKEMAKETNEETPRQEPEQLTVAEKLELMKKGLK